MTIFDSVKSFVSTAVNDIEQLPSVVIGGIEHVVSDGYGGAKTVVSDLYGGVKTVAYDGVNLAGTAEKQALSPFTNIVDSFGYPILFLAGGLGFYIVYEMSQTSRAALPYAPSILSSAGSIAPLFGAI